MKQEYLQYNYINFGMTRPFLNILVGNVQITSFYHLNRKTVSWGPRGVFLMVKKKTKNVGEIALMLQSKNQRIKKFTSCITKKKRNINRHFFISRGITQLEQNQRN